MEIRLAFDNPKQPSNPFSFISSSLSKQPSNPFFLFRSGGFHPDPSIFFGYLLAFDRVCYFSLVFLASFFGSGRSF
ncbi:hypothetical protein PRUPE_7G096600 [Prunus persica]|uniref:Uncharacterized protein n=1 Tax=Prunus persica TaxID=3760 RepID=A0A251N9C2_PRUPE|nr:hypothetical protein PRUPE_7G096600 [Prunus persica]